MCKLLITIIIFKLNIIAKGLHFYILVLYKLSICNWTNFVYKAEISPKPFDGQAISANISAGSLPPPPPLKS